MNKFKDDPRLIGKKVLVANKCRNFRFFISTTFTYVGANVIEATCAHELSQGIEEENPDVVIIDKEMTDIDNLELVKSLMSSEETASVCVLVTTLQKNTRKLISNEPLIVENLLSRPFSPEELLQKVTDVMDKNSKHGHTC